MFTTLVPRGCTSRRRNATRSMIVIRQTAPMLIARPVMTRGAGRPLRGGATHDVGRRTAAYRIENTSRATANHNGPEASRNRPESTKSRYPAKNIAQSKPSPAPALRMRPMSGFRTSMNASEGTPSLTARSATKRRNPFRSYPVGTSVEATSWFIFSMKNQEPWLE
jgi:hypothetical protein